ncbi:MAG: energy-coupling factor transporter transmembrane protein EcfT [Lachnospiraceae bacterium]|nr:energy-coupling factor transporter transmembrane protein EcfT [Lachnospiraceae bacterium]
MSATLSYIKKNSPIHKLTGSTKFIFFLVWSLAAMITYDTRVLVGMFLLGVVFFRMSKLTWKDIRFAVLFMVWLIALNLIALFLFSPEQGVGIYGTRTEIVHLFWRYSIIAEEMFYLFNFMMKYLAVIPAALLFILTTDPSEFAASLNKIGVSYKVGYSVAIALRYIPDIQRDFREISQAQQARGIDLSKKDKMVDRLKNSAAILFPLVLSSLDRIEVISNAMELRGFGKNKKRTWIVERPFKKADYVAIGIAVCAMVISMLFIFLNGGRFYNPFV